MTFLILLLLSFSGNCSEALKIFRDSLKKYYEEEITLEKLVETLERAHKLEPTNAKIKRYLAHFLTELGKKYYLKENLSNAFNCFKKVLELEPTNKIARKYYKLTKPKIEISPKHLRIPTPPKLFEEKKTCSLGLWVVEKLKRLVIAGISNKHLFDRKGVVGSVILKIQGIPVQKFSDAIEVINKSSIGESIKLVLKDTNGVKYSTSVFVVKRQIKKKPPVIAFFCSLGFQISDKLVIKQIIENNDLTRKIKPGDKIIGAYKPNLVNGVYLLHPEHQKLYTRGDCVGLLKDEINGFKCEISSIEELQVIYECCFVNENEVVMYLRVKRKNTAFFLWITENISNIKLL